MSFLPANLSGSVTLELHRGIGEPASSDEGSGGVDCSEEATR